MVESAAFWCAIFVVKSPTWWWSTITPVSPRHWKKKVCFVMAIEKASGEMLFNPSFEALITAGDTLIAVGEEPNLHALACDLNPRE